LNQTAPLMHYAYPDVSLWPVPSWSNHTQLMSQIKTNEIHE
jgi:hypothetical protein